MGCKYFVCTVLDCGSDGGGTKCYSIPPKIFYFFYFLGGAGDRMVAVTLSAKGCYLVLDVIFFVIVYLLYHTAILGLNKNGNGLFITFQNCGINT
jgi:hypothetical protein